MAQLTWSRSSPNGDGAGRYWFTKGLSATCVKGLAMGADGVLGATLAEPSGEVAAAPRGLSASLTMAG